MVQVEGRTIQVPPEVLDQIFAEVSHPGDVKPGASWQSHFYTSSPTTSLFPLLLVNITWSAVAERRLYHCIGIGFTNPYSPHSAQKLAITLSDSPRKAQLVRELHIRIRGQDEQQIRNHISILSSCTNVARLELLGYGRSHAAAYCSILASKSLVTFVLYAFSGAVDDSALCTSSDLLGLIAGWGAALTSVEVNGSEIHKTDKKDDRKLEHTSTMLTSEDSAAACPALRHMRLDNCRFNEREMLALPTIAPFVESLTIRSLRISSAIGMSLQQWAPTLRRLHLSTRMYSVPLSPHIIQQCAHPPSIDNIISSLIHLEHLIVSSTLLSPCAIQHAPPTLKTLEYASDEPNEVEQLIETLKSPLSAPSLTNLKIARTKRGTMYTAELVSVCRARNIQLDLPPRRRSFLMRISSESSDNDD